MEAEETDLERRVLAHARILQTLIRFLAEERPEILSRLKSDFGSGHNIGEYEQDYSSTQQYGDMFIREVEKNVVRTKCTKSSFPMLVTLPVTGEGRERT